ncbi:hypothetical protein Taro_021699, partial [Colocasia esculenta]|nr:hypothetical protein [Colocasia esculenta]
LLPTPVAGGVRRRRRRTRRRRGSGGGRISMSYDDVEIEDMEWNEELKAFTYPCPCGDVFQITREELLAGEEIARCPSCSLYITVVYNPEDFADGPRKEKGVEPPKQQPQPTPKSWKKEAQPLGSSGSGHLPRQGGSWDKGEGFPNIFLGSTASRNPEEGIFGSFLGLPKESFTGSFDPFGEFPKGIQELGVNALDAKISSMRPTILPSNFLNGQTLPLSSSVQNSLVGDTPLEETVESDSERGE